jgi:hypothetical protein
VQSKYQETGVAVVAGLRRLELKPIPLCDATAALPASIVLKRLIDEAPTDYFTLGWLMDSLHQRSFGMIMLLLALIATVPGISLVGSLVLVIPAIQMIVGRPAPVFPRRLAARPFPVHRLAVLVQRAVPVLRFLEKIAHPRWRMPPQSTKRLVGIVVTILSIPLIFSPIPLSGIVPALVIALISLAYLERDGLLLLIGLLIACVVLTIAAAAAWEAIVGADWLSRLW